MTSHPTFALFPKLPIEVRLRIWRTCANQGRLIEIEQSTTWAREHWDVTVCRPSRQTPTILRVCKESRNECMKLYIMARFDAFIPVMHQKNNTMPGEHWVYYNPNVDIIYFGKNTCTRKINHICQLGFQISRIAIAVSENSDSAYDCCAVWFNPNIPFAMSPVHRIANVLHGHGALPPRPHNTVGMEDGRLPGCKGLKDVFWVDEPDFLTRCGSLDENVGFQAAPYEPSGGQKFITGLKDEIGAGKVVLSATNGWLGDEKPDFHWVNLALHPLSSAKCDIIFLRLTAQAQLRRIIKGTRKYAEDVGSKVEIRFEYEDWAEEGDYGVKIVGTREEIEQVKAKIVSLCNVRGRVGGKIEIVDEADAKEPGAGDGKN